MGSQAHDAHRSGEARASTLPLALIPAAVFALLLYALSSEPLPWVVSWLWIPTLDIQFALRVDGLSAQFLLLITGIGSLVFVYASGYLGISPKRWRIFILLILFMFSMIGAVVSDDLICIFLFWELTSVLSFLLVGVDHEEEANRKSALQALLVTGLGGLVLLAGLILLGEIAGTHSMHQLIVSAPEYLGDVRLPAALSLVFVGAFTKSAQFPFHFWLPNAMAAPTPVSAYLHSATLVKLGIFLLARLDAAFSNLMFWEYTLISIGTLTAVSAAMQTVREHDLKRILAWSTVATLGTLTMLVGLPGNGAALAVVALFFAHALYKAPLFFVAGNLSHGAGTRNIYLLSGIRRYMPWTAAAAMLAALSMAGLPLSLGFVAKNAMVYAKADADVFALISYTTTFVNGMAVAVAVISAIHVFWGREGIFPALRPHEAPLTMLLPPLILVSLGLLFGLWPTLIDPMLGDAARAIAPSINALTVDAAYDQALVLETTLLAMVSGIVIFFNWRRLRRWQMRLIALDSYGPESWYLNTLKFVPRAAAWLTRHLQHGWLPYYVQTLVAVVAVSILLLLSPTEFAVFFPGFSTLSLPVLGATLVITTGALAALFVRDHFVLLLVSGLVGYGSAILFLFTGAPDLAFTQFAVETVFVVVAAAVLKRLRHQELSVKLADALHRNRIRPLALCIAIAFGASLTLLTLLVAGLPFDNSLAEFFTAQSLPAAQGRNVVNVIIVDFRALDTLGEISVLAFALLAAMPLLKLVRGSKS